MKGRVFFLSFCCALFLMISCGGGGGSDWFAGSYTGTFEGKFAAKGQSGTLTCTVGHGGIDSYNATLTDKATGNKVIFTGTLSQVDLNNQSFTALEQGGVFAGKMVHIAYNPNVPTLGHISVYVYSPQAPKESAYTMDMTPQSAVVGTNGVNGDTTAG